jgi:hypothetical protein
MLLISFAAAVPNTTSDMPNSEAEGKGQPRKRCSPSPKEIKRLQTVESLLD